MTNYHDYLKHDLRLLLVILLVVAFLLGGLWYIEQHSRGFSQAAGGLLDFFTK